MSDSLRARKRAKRLLNWKEKRRKREIRRIGVDVTQIKKEVHFLIRCIQDIRCAIAFPTIQMKCICKSGPVTGTCPGCMMDYCQSCHLSCWDCNTIFHRRCISMFKGHPVCNVCTLGCEGCGSKIEKLDTFGLRRCGHCKLMLCIKCFDVHHTNWTLLYFRVALDCDVAILEPLRYCLDWANLAYNKDAVEKYETLRSTRDQRPRLP